MLTKRLELRVPIYEQTLTVMVGDISDAIKFLQTKLLPDHFVETERRIQGSRGYAMSLELGSGAHHLFLWLETLDDLEVLVHESLHISFYILDYVGVPANCQHQEAIAYLQTWIFNEIRNRIPLAKSIKTPKSDSYKPKNKSTDSPVCDGLNRSQKRTSALVTV